MESRTEIKKEPICLFRGDENGVVIEKKDYMKSIFRNQYAQALQLIDELGAKRPRNDDKQEDDKFEPLSQPNIIAFCGDRGEGKTSCMMTVRHIIEDKDTEAFIALTGCLPFVALKDYEFLEMIEPAFFDQEHNILELVIGQMFRNFKRYDKDEEIRGSEQQKNVLKWFNRVKKCATLLVAGQTNLYDSIEELDELAASMSLRKNMDLLIKEYLKLTKKEMLVITIDDMDYNWQGAYDMTKMLSKYLSGARCIIMVSVSVQQLVEVVKTSFENDVQHKDTTIGFDVIAAKYINKLIPLHFRVEMPKVLDLCDRPLILMERDARGEMVEDKYESVKYAVVKLIFGKTRYLFYNNVQNVSLIVPDDLRSLRHLLGMLLSMEDYDKNTDNESKMRANLENKRIFQSYLYHTWTQQLSKEDQAFAQRLVYNDQSTVNKLVLNYLKDRVDESVIGTPYYAEILSSANYTYNISIGDVFYVLDYIERNAVDRERKLLVFFVKSYYSILLYTYYDIITRNIKTLHPVKKEDDKEIYKVESWFYTTNMMQRIVNGSYFTYKPGSLLKAKIMGEDVGADLLCLRGFQLHELLTDLSLSMKDYVSFDEKKKEAFQKQFRMAELIMLCISRRSYLNDEGEVEINRSRPNPYFVESFNTEVNFYVFDVLAPFVNLINVKFTYDRFADIIPDMYEWAMQNDWSLLRKMMAKVVENDHSDKKDKYDYQEMRLVSDAIIRNAEILTMVKERLESLDNAHTDTATPAKVIAWYYNTITKNADVRTYDRTTDGKYKRIGYKFLKVMANELNECDDERFTEIVFSYTAELVRNTRAVGFDDHLNIGFK